MQGGLSIVLTMLWAGGAMACSAIELGPCEDLPPPPEDGLLARYSDACPGVFVIEEFAVTASDLWVGAPVGGWRLDPQAMSCDTVPICAPDDCQPVLALPADDCPEGATCWEFTDWPEPIGPTRP